MKYSKLLAVVNHKSSYAGEYLWESYGSASIYDLGETDDPIASAVVANGADASNRDVREITIATDDVAAYRWRDPDYSKAQSKEAKKRGIDNSIAFDSVRWIEVDSEQEILDLLAIYAGDATATHPAMAEHNGSKEQFTVKLDHRYVLEVQASGMDEARKKAEQWINSVRRHWDSTTGIVFIDNYTVKEQVEVDRE